MLAEHRAFFVAIGFSRTLGRPVECVYAKSEHKQHRFAIALNGRSCAPMILARRVGIEGKLPLVKFLPSQRIVAFKGKSEMFQGYDHGDNTHFRVKVMENVAELFDCAANRAFFYEAVEEVGEPATPERQGSTPGRQGEK